MNKDLFSTHLLRWFKQHGRHDLPWQHPRSPYFVWLSEIMLQQTQVKTVIPYFQRFIARFPTLNSLATAPIDDVLANWAGLGYYARGRNLHKAAQQCLEQHDGQIPCDFNALLALPGIGRSTAGAILSQAWGQPYPILDGNVKRLLTRYHGIQGWPGLPQIEAQLWQLATNHLPSTELANYTQAQMDLGATLCTRSRPSCTLCPLQSDCIAAQQELTDTLPTRKPRKPIPERNATYLWAENTQGHVLLIRRPDKGIWSGLWSLPEAVDIETLTQWFNAHLIGDITKAKALPVIPHTFTHYRLQLHPLHLTHVHMRDTLKSDTTARWVAPTELHTLGLPAPIHKLLNS